MKNETVAVLDVRSYEITFFLGTKGVNGNFVISGIHTEKYEGFSSDGFFDTAAFRRAVVAAVTIVRQNHDGKINEIHVGVPSAFVQVATKGHTISFPSKRKISSQDIEALYESGLAELMASGRCIRRSNMYFTLGDNRKYFFADDLYGVPTTQLKGALCYYFISEEFATLAETVLKDLGVQTVRFMPSTLAQSLYLLPEKRREGYAFLLDIGFMTTSVSVVYGNGIVHEETFDFGKGTLLVSLMQNLSVDMETAEEILRSSNVSGGVVPRDLTWTNERGDTSFPVQFVNDVLKCELDVLCESVETFLTKHYREKTATVFAVNPISITGEGSTCVAGAAEHIANRLNRLTEVVYPDLPYYDKPTCSSRIGLLNMAISDRKKRGWFQRFFSKNGGKNK